MRRMRLRTLVKRLLVIIIPIILIIVNYFGGEKVTLAQEKRDKTHPVNIEEEQYNGVYALIERVIHTFAQVYMSQVAQKELEEAKENEVLLYFTGDIMCLGGQQRSVRAKNYSFDSSFCYLKELFSQADFVCGNLETLISKSNPTTEEQNTVNDNPNCNTQSSFAVALKEAGFSAVTTANNHAYDWGKGGVIETLSVLDTLKIPQTGLVAEDALPYLLKEIKGVKVAVLSYTELINSRTMNNASECAKVIHCYDAVQMSQDIKMAREAGAEFVIVSMHWGKENTTIVTPRQKQHAKEIALAGADVIIGSHPHCLQEATFIEGVDGKQVLCVYSMGNFVSSMVRECNKQSILLAIRINKSKEGKLHFSYEYQPICTIGMLEGNPFTVVPTNLEGVPKDLQTNLLNAEQQIKETVGDAIPILRKKDVIPQG